ncbi:DUF4097 family beta strand repeat protein [candidate division KSB1 bacterium]|nr:DUF4097 family beta strand repeat protein [candidate division KSB1 bacterium]
MKSVSRNYQWASIAIAALLLIASPSARGEIEDRIKKSFEVGSGGQLTLTTDLGLIEVQAVDGNTLEVEVIRKVYARNRKKADEILEDFEIEFSQSGKDVDIRAEYKGEKRRFWDFDQVRLRVRYLISVPREYNVDLKTAGGSISVDDLEGEVRSKTSGGSLHFGRIQGPVWGKTSGGSIELDGCRGKAEVKTSGGSISIGEVDGDVLAHTSGGSIRIKRAKGSVDAKTSGGSITVEEVMGSINATTSGGTVKAHISRQPQGDCRLATSGGSVVVYMTEDIAVDVDAKTSGGRVVTELPVTVQGELSKTSLQAKINGGGPALVLRTSGGNIHLRKM